MKIINKFKGKDDSIHYPVSFAWANYNVEEDTAHRITKLFSCRTYITDILWDIKIGRKCNSRSNVANCLLDDSKLEEHYTCLLVYLEHKKIIDILSENIKDYLNPVEEKNGFIPTRIKIDESDTIVLIGGDKRWSANLFMNTLWTYLIKVLTKKIPKNTSWDYNLKLENVYCQEKQYYKRVKNVIHDVLLDLNNIIENCPTLTSYPDEGKYNFNIHTNTGFYYLLSNRGYSGSLLDPYLVKKYGKVSSPNLW